MLPINTARFRGIPIGKHPGAFGAIRKHDIHTGVDLYCTEGTRVYSMESGVVIKIDNFTGPSMGYPWWLETKAIMVRHNSGAIAVYGELIPNTCLRVGDVLQEGALLGLITPVLPPEKHRPDLPGHSVNMLHLELWKNPAPDLKWEGWELNEKRPSRIMDPTHYLKYQWELNHTREIPILTV